MGKAGKRSTRAGVGGHRHRLSDAQRRYVDAIAALAEAGGRTTVRSIADRVRKSVNATRRMLERLEQLRVIRRGKGQSGSGRPIELVSGNPDAADAQCRARIGQKLAELPDAALPDAERCIDEASEERA